MRTTMSKRNKPVTAKAVYRPRLDCYVIICQGRVIDRIKDRDGVSAFLRGWLSEANKLAGEG